MPLAYQPDHSSSIVVIHSMGEVTDDDVRHIADTKMVDLNANDVDAAMKIVEGTARSMGITVEG